MVKTGKEVSKSSFIIFTALIRIGVTVKKTFPHSPHLLCGHIKSFENYWKTALTLLPPPCHCQACTPLLPNPWEKQWSLKLVISMPSVIHWPLSFPCEDGNDPICLLMWTLTASMWPCPPHSCVPCGGPTWISHRARPGSSLSLLFSLDLWR